MKLPHLSVSTIEAFTICPRRAYLNKTTSGARVQNAATSLGSAVHETLEQYHGGTFKGECSLVELFDKVILGYDVNDFGRFNDARKFLAEYEKINTYQTPTIGVEIEFNMPIGDFMVKGIIDRIDYLGDGVYKVIDYKTSFVKKERYELDQDIQLLTYDIATRYLWEEGQFPGLPKPEKVICELNYLRHGPMETSFSDEDRDSAEQYIKYMGYQIDMIDEEPSAKANQYCGWCEHRNSCALYTSNFARCVDEPLCDEIEELADQLQTMRHISKVTTAKIKEAQNQLLLHMEEDQLNSIITPELEVRKMANSYKTTDYDSIKKAIPDWRDRFAKIDLSGIEEAGTEEEQALIDKYTATYESSPYVRVFRTWR